mmetsp:Transcript_73681/g.149056  ORF Transcript_73681/g.149056 Transcript_73681/m.149056 type:complete len:539 (-) Transcript_73681:232-1848(-)
MDAESVLKELESLQQLHVEQHQQLSLALSNSHALMEKFKTLTSQKKSVTIHSMPSQKSQRREDRRESFRSAKIQSRVQSVEQLGFALVFGESARKTHRPSIESDESIQNIDPSTMTGRLGSQPSQPSLFPASGSQPFDLIPVPMVGDVNVPAELPGALDPGLNGEKRGHTTLTLSNINKGAQSEILEKWVVQEDGQEPDDLGSKILLKMPRILYVAVPVQALILAACLLFSDSLGNLQGQYYSSVISKFFYTIASAVCPYFLLTSLRSADLMLSVGKLNEFLADFNLHWSSVSGQRWRRYALMWMCLVLVEIATQALFILDGISGEHGAFHSGHVINWLCVVSFAICSSLVVVVAYTQCHLLAALDKSLDCWCFNIASDPDFDLGVLTWNRLQALLKCVGRSLASSFIAMQVLGAVGFVYSLASGIMVCFQFDFAGDKILREVLSSLPLLFLFALNMTVCTTGASLTEKCRNIPALVNQLPSDICIDTDRQYLVNFLKDSAAGFCVKDIRLTREMLAKQFIIIGGVISGLFAALSRAI